ncbi:MAG: transcription termination/antitermination protein NusA [Actinobacteria bacterium]|nr:transcription termination/antitermination protein NusA [Actinomycetota bacterium]
MLLIENLAQVANQIEAERGVSRETLFSAIEQALISACRKMFENEMEFRVALHEETGEATIYRVYEVVSEVEEAHTQMALKEAKKHRATIKVGDTLEIQQDIPNFGRIAAQTAKQVIVQRIREAEKQSVFEEFSEKEGKVLSGVVQRVEARNYLINLGRTEAILPFREVISGETFHLKDRIKVYVIGVDKGSRGNVVTISRTHGGLLRCLLEAEVPEIQEGIIDVISVAREPGKRAKVAVKSNSPTIGAVGTCVGQMGSRIQVVTKELSGERIDILEWHEDPRAFIASALKPAKVSSVTILDEDAKTARVVVPNDQLSLAIGKRGVNVRLSVRLTGWNLDILSEEEDGKGGAEDSGLSLEEKLKASQETTDEGESTEVSDAAEASEDAPVSGLAAKIQQEAQSDATEASSEEASSDVAESDPAEEAADSDESVSDSAETSAADQGTDKPESESASTPVEVAENQDA